MIWLTDAALRYATDLCGELDDQTVIVFLRDHHNTDNVTRKLRTFLKNKRNARVFNEAVIWHAQFENGSQIKIVPATDQVRGNRCHLAIVDRGVSREIVDTVIRPMEILQNIDDNNNDGIAPATQRDDHVIIGGTITADRINARDIQIGTPLHYDGPVIRHPADIREMDLGTEPDNPGHEFFGWEDIRGRHIVNTDDNTGPVGDHFYTRDYFHAPNMGFINTDRTYDLHTTIPNTDIPDLPYLNMATTTAQPANTNITETVNNLTEAIRNITGTWEANTAPAYPRRNVRVTL